MSDKLKFTSTHEWARVEDDDTVTVGISEHAQKLLGDVVFVESPQIGTELKAGEETGVIESVKAASDLYAPLTGEVIEVNGDLAQNPGLVNEQPYQAGWLYRIRPYDLNEMDDLLDSETYAEKIGSEEEA